MTHGGFEAGGCRVMAERRRQVEEKGWTAEHDAGHTMVDWVAILSHELGCAARVALKCPDPLGPLAFNRALQKIGAVAVAALDARQE